MTRSDIGGFMRLMLIFSNVSGGLQCRKTSSGMSKVAICVKSDNRRTSSFLHMFNPLLRYLRKSIWTRCICPLRTVSKRSFKVDVHYRTIQSGGCSDRKLPNRSLIGFTKIFYVAGPRLGCSLRDRIRQWRSLFESQCDLRGEVSCQAH